LLHAISLLMAFVCTNKQWKVCHHKVHKIKTKKYETLAWIQFQIQNIILSKYIFTSITVNKMLYFNEKNYHIMYIVWYLPQALFPLLHSGTVENLLPLMQQPFWILHRFISLGHTFSSLLIYLSTVINISSYLQHDLSNKRWK
jgi:hypothetical protein